MWPNQEHNCQCHFASCRHPPCAQFFQHGGGHFNPWSNTPFNPRGHPNMPHRGFGHGFNHRGFGRGFNHRGFGHGFNNRGFGHFNESFRQGHRNGPFCRQSGHEEAFTGRQGPQFERAPFECMFEMQGNGNQTGRQTV